MRVAVAIALLPTLAVAQDGGDREALYTALAMNQCAVSEDETPAVFGSQGFDPEYVRQELGQMILDETAYLEAGRILRVKADHCPPTEPVPTPAQSFRQMIADNGCSIEESEMGRSGFDADLMRPAVQSWLDDGSARVDGRTLKLTDCG